MQHLIGSLGWVRPETAFHNTLRQWFNSEVLKGIKLPTTQTDFNRKKNRSHTHTIKYHRSRVQAQLAHILSENCLLLQLGFLWLASV